MASTLEQILGSAQSLANHYDAPTYVFQILDKAGTVVSHCQSRYHDTYDSDPAIKYLLTVEANPEAVARRETDVFAASWTKAMTDGARHAIENEKDR